VRSVRRIQREPGITTADTKALIQAHGVGQPAVASPWAAVVAAWLEVDRDLPTVEVVRRLREGHAYPGGKCVVYELVRRLRPVTVAPMFRFEGAVGELSQHDFGHVDIRYTSGQVERVHFFASRLKSTRFAHVTQSLEPLQIR
jgi:hypothetical protein